MRICRGLAVDNCGFIRISGVVGWVLADLLGGVGGCFVFVNEVAEGIAPGGFAMVPGRRRGGVFQSRIFEGGGAGFDGGLGGGDAALTELLFVGLDALFDEGIAETVHGTGIVSCVAAVSGDGVIQFRESLLIGVGVEFGERGEVGVGERFGLGGIAVLVDGNEVVLLRVRGRGDVQRPVAGSGGVFFGAPFFLGEKAFVEILEDGEFVGEFADGHIAAECFEDARLDHGENGAAECAGMSLAGKLNGAGALAEEMGRAGVLIIAGVEADECAVTGLQLQTFGTRQRDDIERLVVGMLIAKFDDALLVLGREEREFGTRFAGFDGNRGVVDGSFHGCVPFFLVRFKFLLCCSRGVLGTEARRLGTRSQYGL